jgi:pyruvate ferredoxin oxidoreductase beta subunit
MYGGGRIRVSADGFFNECDLVNVPRHGIHAFRNYRYAVGFAGDGGTADIGIQALSGAIDRNDRLIYICYDNEGYMNTGIQKSGLTPYGTRTTTTPAGTNLPGSVTHKKNLFEIIAAHGIEYAAVASIGYRWII